MGVRVTDLRNNEREVTIDLWGMKVKAWYRPMALSFKEENEFTKRWRAEQELLEKTLAGELKQEDIDQEERNATFEYLEKLIGRWELINDALDEYGKPRLDADGQVMTYPTPITVAEMRDNLPPALTMSFFVEIGRDRTPNSLRGGTSGEPSSEKQESEGSFQTGT